MSFSGKCVLNTREELVLSQNLEKLCVNLNTLIESENEEANEMRRPPGYGQNLNSTVHCRPQHMGMSFQKHLLDSNGRSYYEKRGFDKLRTSTIRQHNAPKFTQGNNNSMLTRRGAKQSRSHGEEMEFIVWKNEYIRTGQLHSNMLLAVGLRGDLLEHNLVIRIFDLFRMFHDHLHEELPTSQLNAFPSGYLYEWPKKITMPSSMCVRYQVQVLTTKLSRFLAKQRRVLDTNRNFDYLKYSECNKLMQYAQLHLNRLTDFSTFDIRHRNGEFVSNKAKDKALQLEQAMIDMHKWLRDAYITIFVFNWDMDCEHRSSMAMAQARESVEKVAFTTAIKDLQQAVKSSNFNDEDQMIASVYDLDNVVQCAKEHEEYLDALLQCPSNFFSPEVVAMCEPPKRSYLQHELAISKNYEEMYLEPFIAHDIIEGPSTPPRLRSRSHIPKVFRG